MMNKRMMVMMTATAMRVMMAITTMNGGAGASDVFFWLALVHARLSPARGTHAARPFSHEARKRNAHMQGQKIFFPGKRTPSHQRARGSARSQIRIARRHSTLSTPGLCKHPPARKLAPRAYT